MKARIGDVINHARKEHVVIFVNESRALIIPLTFAVTWKDMPTGHTHFMAEGKGESISPNFESEDVIRHMSVAEMKSHFGGVSASSNEQPTTAEHESNSMKKTAQTAATIAATTATAPAPVKMGKTGKRGKSKEVTAADVAAAVQVPAVASPAPAETPEVRPSQKGTLIGRGAYVLELGAKFDYTKPTDLAEFTKLVQAKWPVCGVNWCAKHLKRANLRLQERAARRKAAEEAAAEASKQAEAKKKADAEAAVKVAAEAAKTAPANGTAAPDKKGGKKSKADKTVAA